MTRNAPFGLLYFVGSRRRFDLAVIYRLDGLCEAIRTYVADMYCWSVILKIGRKKNLLGFIVAIFVMCGLLWLGIVAWNQQDRDYDLTEAVGRRDMRKVRQLLEAGANPDAQWSGYSWRDRFDHLVRRTDGYEGYTVLDRVKGDSEMVNLLLRYRARKK